MPHQFNEYDREPETQASAIRSMGPPGKRIGTGLIDPPESVPPAVRWPRISLWAGIILLLSALAAYFATFLLRR